MTPPPAAVHGGGSSPGVYAAAAMGVEYLEDIVLDTVREVHTHVARRVFGLGALLAGRPARIPQVVHDGVTSTVYEAIGGGVKLAAAGLRAADRRGHGRRLEETRGGRQMLSAANGLLGHRLVTERPELAIAMAVRRDGHDVPATPSGLVAAYPKATDRLVVLVHGLGENDDSWERGSHRVGGSYSSRLLEETGWTPVVVRLNTGLPITHNGAALAELLDELVAAWPTEVRRIALVGHSMGGLIIRAACAAVTAAEVSWTSLVTNVVTLGTPHLGAPLERGIHAGALMLSALPASAPFGRILEHRSVGILDLRHGLAADIQHLPHARYHLVAATLAFSHRHPVSELFGDLVVRYPSATGRPRRKPAMFPDSDVLHVPRSGHLHLLNHPEVYHAIKRWLA
jgi:pimeloyl-ACP methyl ester carboxylesterase